MIYAFLFFSEINLTIMHSHIILNFGSRKIIFLLKHCSAKLYFGEIRDE